MDEGVFAKLSDSSLRELADLMVTRQILAALLRNHPDGGRIFDEAKGVSLRALEGKTIDPRMAEALRTSFDAVGEALGR